MVFEVQAHRGARSFFPENTLQAFCKAAHIGVRVLELDLVVSRDHEIVVSHDPWLSGPLCSDPHGYPLSLDDRQYIIYDMRYDEIARFDCGRQHPCFSAQQPVRAAKPLLSTVFRVVDSYMVSANLKGAMIYNLEIKSWPDKDGVFHPSPERYAALLLQLIENAGLSLRVRIQSFDDRVLREAWKLDSGLCYGLLIDKREGAERLLLESDFSLRYVNPHFSLVNPEITEYLHTRGVRMIPWTVNETEEMLAMKLVGADGIITDYPERAIALFGGQQ